MDAQFEFYLTPQPKPDSEERYHARIVGARTVGMGELAEMIQGRCTVTSADTKAVLAALSDVMVEVMSEGNRIHLSELGYFYPTLECDAVSHPDEATAGDVRFKSVRFMPEASLKKRMKAGMKLRKSRQSGFHSRKCSDEEMDGILRRHFASNPTITRKTFGELCGLKRCAALQWITRLVEEGRLVNVGTARMPVYMPADPGTGQK